jgi:nitronate monooxygenase
MDNNPAPHPLERVQSFNKLVGIQIPILLAPMAGACPPALSIAVANAGGLGACGAVLLNADAITAWCEEFRHGSSGEFQLNLWIPDPPPPRDHELEALQREFLAAWGPPVPVNAGDAVLLDFEAQCAAILAAKPRVISSIMGLYSPEFVAEMKSRGILWFATATTVDEARAAEAAGADAILAQGMEAGGHRGAFRPEQAESQLVGLFALVPQVADAVSIPVVATGGIGDARGVAAALILGASAVQIGTGFLRAHESNVHRLYANRLSITEAHHTTITRAFTGRAGRSIKNAYVHASAAAGTASPAPYPLQRGFTRAMREDAIKAADPERLQMWSGQAAKFAQALPAGEIVRQLWTNASRLLS